MTTLFDSTKIGHRYLKADPQQIIEEIPPLPLQPVRRVPVIVDEPTTNLIEGNDYICLYPPTQFSVKIDPREITASMKKLDPSIVSISKSVYESRAKTSRTFMFFQKLSKTPLQKMGENFPGQVKQYERISWIVPEDIFIPVDQVISYISRDLQTKLQILKAMIEDDDIILGQSLSIHSLAIVTLENYIALQHFSNGRNYNIYFKRRNIQALKLLQTYKTFLYHLKNILAEKKIIGV